jgi:hypothetical protein
MKCGKAVSTCASYLWIPVFTVMVVISVPASYLWIPVLNVVV